MSITAPDALDHVVDALKDYFSPPIARALLLSTLRRAKMNDATLEPHAIPQVIQALESVLPMYIADAGRRGACLGHLRKLLPPAEARARDAPRAGDTAHPTESHGRLVAARAATSTSTVIQLATAEDVANASEVGRDLARRVGFAHVMQTKIATAIAELARNIVLYAVSGEMRIAGLDAPRRGVEIVASDEGPGIPDLALVMSGGYRSRTGMGMGLRGAKRLMDVFEIETSSFGTTVIARKFLA
jgi:serine/threonine-protein kinase RsbT